MSPRRRSSVPALAWGATAFLLLAALGAAGDVLHHALGQAVAAVLIAVTAYALGRRGRRNHHRQECRPVREQAADELAWLRRQVTELETAAGRPLATITASYRRIQGQYRDGGDRS